MVAGRHPSCAFFKTQRTIVFHPGSTYCRHSMPEKTRGGPEIRTNEKQYHSWLSYRSRATVCDASSKPGISVVSLADPQIAHVVVCSKPDRRAATDLSREVENVSRWGETSRRPVPYPPKRLRLYSGPVLRVSSKSRWQSGRFWQ